MSEPRNTRRVTVRVRGARVRVRVRLFEGQSLEIAKTFFFTHPKEHMSDELILVNLLLSFLVLHLYNGYSAPPRPTISPISPILSTIVWLSENMLTGLFLVIAIRAPDASILVELFLLPVAIAYMHTAAC